MPSSISNISEVENWLDSLLDASIPDFLRFAFINKEDGNYFEKLIIKYESKVLLLSPDDNDAYTDLIEDNEDPLVQFRTHFLKFGEFVSAGDYDLAIKHGESALNVARQQTDLEQLEVGILNAMAEVLIEDEAQRNKAMKLLADAESSARRACEKDNPAGKTLLIQTMITSGSMHIYLESFNTAIKYFETAINSAENDEYCRYYLMEAQRLMALCYEHNGDYIKAWNFNEDALSTAGNLAEQIRLHTTVPSIGDALIRLSYKLKREQEVSRINAKMIEYVGEHWEDLI